MRYAVSVKASYYEDMEIEADSAEDAYKEAIKAFVPTSDNCLSIDVYGLSPWDLQDEGDPDAYDKYRQSLLDDAL
jgi:hypothetical protein